MVISSQPQIQIDRIIDDLPEESLAWVGFLELLIYQQLKYYTIMHIYIPVTYVNTADFCYQICSLYGIAIAKMFIIAMHMTNLQICHSSWIKITQRFF